MPDALAHADENPERPPPRRTDLVDRFPGRTLLAFQHMLVGRRR